MRLLSAETVRVALGEMNYEDVNTLLDTALSLVTPSMETLLQTKFDAGSFEDIFFIDYESARVRDPFISLKLSRGFLDMLTPFSIYNTTYIADIGNVGVTDIPYLINYDMGLVTFQRKPTGIVKVVFDAGWEATGGTYDPAMVPDWLQSAVILYTSVVYHRLIDQKNAESNKKNSAQSLLAVPPELTAMIQNHIRWFPTAQTPEYTVAV